MANPKWFDDNVYMNNKLAQLKALDADTYGSWDMYDLEKAFTDAGFQGDEGAFAHFNQYGNTPDENLSPNSNFVAKQYYIFKAASYYEKAVADVTPAEAAYIASAIEKAGMSAWQHYVDYGTEEGINPSNNFDTNKYLDAKLAALKAADPEAYGEWTRADVAKAISDAGMNALSHAIQYADGTTAGEAAAPFDENGNVIDAYKVDNKAASDDTGSTFTLTDKIDVLTGTSGDDTFIGDNTTAQSADQLDGGEGTDTLELYGLAGMPNIKNIETVKFVKANVDADAGKMASIDGVKTVIGDQLTGENTFTVTDSQNVTLSNMAAQDGLIQTITGGDAFTTANITLDKVGTDSAGTIAVTGTNLATMNLTTENNASAFTLTNEAGKLATLNVAGDQKVTVTEALAALKTIDASTATGNVIIKTTGLVTDNDITMTGGSGNDAIWFKATQFTNKDVIDLGAGDADKVVVAEAGVLSADNYTALNGYKNVEVLGSSAAGLTVDVSKLTNGIKDFAVEKGGDLTTSNSLSSTVYSVDLGDNSGAAGLVIANKTGESKTTVNIDNQSGAQHTLAALNVMGITDVTITSTGKSGSTNVITDITNSDNSGFTISGDANLTINGTLDATANGTGSKVDASALTGKLTVTGSAMSDIIIGGSKADTLGGGATTVYEASADAVKKVIALDITGTATTGDATIAVSGTNITYSATANEDNDVSATGIAGAIQAKITDGTLTTVDSVSSSGNTVKVTFTLADEDNGTFTLTGGASSLTGSANAGESKSYSAAVEGDAGSADTLTGNGGADVFVIDVQTDVSGDGRTHVYTTITDFENGSDKIAFDGFAQVQVKSTFATLKAFLDDAATNIEAGDAYVGSVGGVVYAALSNGTDNQYGNVVKITGVSLTDIDADDFQAA